MAKSPYKANARGALSRTRRLRVYQRAHIPGHVMLHDQKHLFIAPIENISAGGMFIQNLVSLVVGSEVRVVLKSPSLPSPIQAMGTVVRVEKEDRRGLAIEFTSISSHARESIQNCVFEARMETALKVA